MYIASHSRPVNTSFIDEGREKQRDDKRKEEGGKWTTEEELSEY